MNKNIVVGIALSLAMQGGAALADTTLICTTRDKPLDMGPTTFTLDETKRLMQEAIELHLRAMREDGDPIPEPSHIVDVLEVA